MRYWIRVLGNRIRDLGTCLVLMSDTSVLLIINTSDGWQRLASAANLKVSNCSNILLTSLTPGSIGGFAGFSLAESGRKCEKTGTSCKMGGPRNMKAYCDSLARAAYDKYWSGTEFVDEHAKPVVWDKKFTIAPIVLSAVNMIDVVSYMVQPVLTKGNFKGEEAKKLGLTLEQIKALIAGKDVSLADGKVITPKEMVTEPVQPKGALIMFVPDKGYLKSLLNSKQLADCANSQIGVVYHSAGFDIVSDPSYWETLGRIAPEALHVIDCKDLNNDTCPRYFSQTFVHQLSTCNSRLFPKHILSPMHTASTEKRKVLTKLFAKLNLAHAFSVIGHDYFFWPTIEASKSSIMPGLHQPDLLAKDLTLSSALSEQIKATPELSSIQEACNKIVPTKKYLNEPTIVMLGTMSQRPSKYRNVSSIYLSIPGDFADKTSTSYGILLDCGEDTYGQLVDHFSENSKRIEEVAENLKVIFISHYHGDHILGLPKVLKECDDLLYQKYGLDKRSFISKERSLYLILPNNFRKFVELRNQLCGLRFIERIKIIESEWLSPIHVDYVAKTGADSVFDNIGDIEEVIAKFYKTGPKETQEMWGYLGTYLKLTRLHTFDVDHEEGSHGIVLAGENWKITYSSDTLPCKSVEIFGKNSDLLIYECTFADNKLPKKKKEEGVRHSTLDQSLGIFDKATPWRMLLTHFSGRYKKVIKITEEHCDKRKMFIAYDHLQFKLSDAEWIHMLQPLLEKVIVDD